MKIGQKIECQACGASSVIKHVDKSILECQYCGAMMTYSAGSKEYSSNYVQQKPAKLGLLLVMIPIAVIVLMYIFWLTFQNIRKNRSIESYEHEVSNVIKTKTQETAQYALKTTEKPQHENSAPTDEKLIIQNQVSGKTSNGGKYWIFGIKNSSDQQQSRAGVMLSLFDKDGLRIEEQGGWSMREVLEPGEETAVLLYLNELPVDAVKQQITTFSSQPNQSSLKQVELKVKEYSIRTKNNQFEIIGDVLNNHQSPVSYVRLVAVAYNSVGEPVGIGNAFSTIKELAPGENSGFKIRVGTFLTAEPESWQVWALGRQ